MRPLHYVPALLLVTLYLGLTAGYSIGKQTEAKTHRSYIQSLNLNGGR